MRNELGDVRRSQIITTHGPGSIIDFRAGGYGGAGISVVGAGLEEWDRWAPPPGLGNPQTVYEPRLQKQLGVDGFRLPPVAPQSATTRRAGGLMKAPRGGLGRMKGATLPAHLAKGTEAPRTEAAPAASLPPPDRGCRRGPFARPSRRC
jgi:hypothetical protein